MLSVLTNINVVTGLAHLARHQRAVGLSMERLATGQRINRASDDPAGSAAATKLAAEIASIQKEMDSYVFEDKRLGAVDGAQSVMSDLLLDLSGLIPASANTGAMTKEEREANQIQVDSILQTIDYLATTTRFDGQLIVSHMTSGAMGLAELRAGGKLNMVDGDLEAAQRTVEDALHALNINRAGAGARGQEIQSKLDTLGVTLENLTEARSRIVDTDFAAETAQFVRATMLRNVAQFVTGLALKSNSELVLKLLQPLGLAKAA